MKAYRDEQTGRWHSDLPDVFNLICEKLRNKEPFSFSRWGDGEWNAVYGKQGHNCDGHEYFPDMGKRLRQVLESKPTYMMGLQPLTISSDRIIQIQKDFPGIDWVDADSIHNASIDGRIGELFDSLKGRNVLVVGPKHIAKINFKEWNFVFVPYNNCWSEYNSIKRELYLAMNHINTLNKESIVVLFCASMMSEVLIDDFSYLDYHTFIDIGSAFDPYAGVKSRGYHHKLSI